jgi:AcrR family transcriptional regulator
MRRQEILRAAAKVFASRGYEGASLREIGEVIGISKGNLSYYFAIKDDLLFEIVNGLHDRLLELADEWPTFPGPPRACLGHALRSHVLMVCNEQDVVRVSNENFRYLSEQRRIGIIRKRERYESKLRDLILDSGPSPAAKGHAHIATHTVLGSLNHPYQWYSPDGEYLAEDIADLVADMALRSLGL